MKEEGEESVIIDERDEVAIVFRAVDMGTGRAVLYGKREDFGCGNTI